MPSRHFDFSQEKNLHVDRGATMKKIVRWGNKLTGPYDLTGVQVKFEAFTTETSIKVLDAGTFNGKIVVDPLQGKMTITEDANVTLTLPDTLYYYLTVFFPNGESKRILRGNLECVGIRGTADPSGQVFL